MKATAHLLPSEPAPASEQSSVRRQEASTLTSSPAQRGTRLTEKINAARAVQRRLPVENRHGQLLGIAILRRDEALLDELLHQLKARRA